MLGSQNGPLMASHNKQGIVSMTEIVHAHKFPFVGKTSIDVAPLVLKQEIQSASLMLCNFGCLVFT